MTRSEAEFERMALSLRSSPAKLATFLEGTLLEVPAYRTSDEKPQLRQALVEVAHAYEPGNGHGLSLLGNCVAALVGISEDVARDLAARFDLELGFRAVNRRIALEKEELRPPVS